MHVLRKGVKHQRRLFCVGTARRPVGLRSFPTEPARTRTCPGTYRLDLSPPFSSDTDLGMVGANREPFTQCTCASGYPSL